MRVLVTGADGMLGTNLILVLLKKRMKVNAFIHPSSKSKNLEGLNIKKYFGDILQASTLDEPMANSDIVIHTASDTRIWPSRSVTIRKTNIKGTENVINGSLKHGIKQLIYIGSASSVNTAASNNKRYSFPGEKFGLDYIDSKHSALLMVMDAIKNRNLPAIALLPTFMIGPYDSLPGSGKLILKLAKGKLRFYTGGGRNFVCVADVVSLIISCMENHTIGKFYVACNQNLSYRAFFEKVSAVTGCQEPNLRIPNWAVLVFGFLGSFVGKLIKKEPLISYPMAKIVCGNQFVSCDKTINDLKMPQTPIELAIKDCYEWFRKNGKL